MKIHALWPRGLAALFVLCLGTLAGCGGGAPITRATPTDTGDPALADARDLWGTYCALCHGESGEGYAADNATRLRGQRFLTTVTDDFVRVAIGRGRHGTAMAGYASELGGPLQDTQIEELVRLVRSWQTDPSVDVSRVTVSGDVESGARLFEQHCQSCHGPLADGGPSAQSLNRWSFLSQASDGFLRYAIENGREDTPMPGFVNSLGHGDIDDLVAFLREYEEEPHHLPEYLAPPSLADMPLLRHPDGEAPSFTLRDDRFVSALQVRDALAAGQRVILLDARPTSDWYVRRLPGALPVPYYDIAPIIERLPRDGTFVVAYCGCPHAASGEVVDAIRAAGFENTAVLDEGVYHWIEQDYPTETGPAASP